MEHEFIAHHIKEDSGLEHLIASMQPRKHSEDYSKQSMEHWRIPETLEALGKALEDSRSTRQCLRKYSTPAGLDYEELGGMSDPGQRDCSQAWNILE